jgi:hypothetical protein
MQPIAGRCAAAAREVPRERAAGSKVCCPQRGEAVQAPRVIPGLDQRRAEVSRRSATARCCSPVRANALGPPPNLLRFREVLDQFTQPAFHAGQLLRQLTVQGGQPLGRTHAGLVGRCHHATGYRGGMRGAASGGLLPVCWGPVPQSRGLRRGRGCGRGGRRAAPRTRRARRSDAAVQCPWRSARGRSTQGVQPRSGDAVTVGTCEGTGGLATAGLREHRRTACPPSSVNQGREGWTVTGPPDWEFTVAASDVRPQSHDVRLRSLAAMSCTRVAVPGRPRWGFRGIAYPSYRKADA